MKFETIIVNFPKVFDVKDINYIKQLLNRKSNEDYFWAVIIANAFNNFRVAGVKDAIKFSFEVNPHILFKMNKNRLPFGCHAWEKYTPSFGHHS